MLASRTAANRMTASPIRTTALRSAPSVRAGALEQPIELRILELRAVEQRVKKARVGAQVDASFRRIEGLEQPAQADQPVDRRRGIDPAPWQAGRQVDLVLGHRAHLSPAGLGLPPG